MGQAHYSNRAQMVQSRLITWKYKSDHDMKYLVLQTKFKYLNNLQD